MKKIDVIITLAFGMKQGGHTESNKVLAELTLYEMTTRNPNLPAIVQREIFDVLFDGIEEGMEPDFEIFQIRQKNPGKYLNTRDVLLEAKKICDKKGWVNIMIIAHPDHRFRAKLLAHNLGFKNPIMKRYSVPYDASSSQKWTRNSFRFWFYDVFALIHHALHGWI